MDRPTESWISRRVLPFWWRTWPAATDWRGFLARRAHIASPAGGIDGSRRLRKSLLGH